MNFPTLAALLVAQVLAGVAVYRWGYGRGNEEGDRAGFIRGMRSHEAVRKIAATTDGPFIVETGRERLLRATPDEVDAMFGPRGVVPR